MFPKLLRRFCGNSDTMSNGAARSSRLDRQTTSSFEKLTD